MAEEATITPSPVTRIAADKNDAEAVQELNTDTRDLIAQIEVRITTLSTIEASGHLSVRETRKLKTALTKARDALRVYEEYLADRSTDIINRTELRAEKNALKTRITDVTPEQMEAINALLDGDPAKV